MTTKISSTFTTKMDRKTELTISFEHVVADPVDAEEAGYNAAKLMAAYTEGFARAPLRRY